MVHALRSSGGALAVGGVVSRPPFIGISVMSTSMYTGRQDVVCGVPCRRLFPSSRALVSLLPGGPFCSGCWLATCTADTFSIFGVLKSNLATRV